MTISNYKTQPLHPVRNSGPANDNRSITVASDRQLRDSVYVRRLALATNNLDMPRRDIPDWMSDVIYWYEGDILYPNGKLYPVPDTLIDDVFNHDGSFRWLSDFVKWPEKPTKQRPQARVIERIRCIDLAFRIDKPMIARHFNR